MMLTEIACGNRELKPGETVGSLFQFVAAEERSLAEEYGEWHRPEEAEQRMLMDVRSQAIDTSTIALSFLRLIACDPRCSGTGRQDSARRVVL